MFKIIETLILNENTPTQNSFPGPKFYREKKQAPGHGICLHERRNFGTYFLYFVYFFVPFEAF